MNDRLIERLREALRVYGGHVPPCVGRPCQCGFKVEWDRNFTTSTPAVETSCVGWLPLDYMTAPPSGKYLVGHRGHQVITHYLNPKDTHFHIGAKLGWQEDPFKFGATHYMLLPEVEAIGTVKTSAPQERPRHIHMSGICVPDCPGCAAKPLAESPPT